MTINHALSHVARMADLFWQPEWPPAATVKGRVTHDPSGEASVIFRVRFDTDSTEAVDACADAVVALIARHYGDARSDDMPSEADVALEMGGATALETMDHNEADEYVRGVVVPLLDEHPHIARHRVEVADEGGPLPVLYVWLLSNKRPRADDGDVATECENAIGEALRYRRHAVVIARVVHDDAEMGPFRAGE